MHFNDEQNYYYNMSVSWNSKQNNNKLINKYVFIPTNNFLMIHLKIVDVTKLSSKAKMFVIAILFNCLYLLLCISYTKVSYLQNVKKIIRRFWYILVFF